MSSSLVNNKYRITRRIGGGSFGEIYLGVGPSGEKVAVKFERHGTRCPQLRHEYKVYRELHNCHGFCSVYHFGTQDNYNVMVMDLLGPSLEDLFNKCSRRFSLKTVLQLADQLLERVDTLHARHLIHRDIKPANFVIGVGDTSTNVFCVDFGLSKRYRHPKNLQHIPHRDGRSLTGTPRYASINNHLGVEQSRRDDLESIGYVLIYFLKGSLPWQGLKAKNAQKKYRMILEKKQQVSIAQLCQGCPSQFAEFLAYARSLKFDAKPDIPYLRKLFRDLFHAQGFAGVGKVWDWDGLDSEFLSNGNSNNNTNAPGGELMEDGGAGGMERPGTAAAVASRPTSSWGFTSRQQGEQMVPEAMKADQQANGGNPGLTRPHTAGAAGQRPGPGGGGGAMQIDPRTGKVVGEEGEGVVASARALMRYRRSRNSTGDGEEGVSGAPRITVYQNPSRAPQQGGFSGSNWMGGDGGVGGARPKSAGVSSSGGGLMNTFGGNKMRGSNGAEAGQSGLTYGAIKNRFLSSAQNKKSGSAKLFTSR